MENKPKYAVVIKRYEANKKDAQATAAKAMKTGAYNVTIYNA